MRMRCLLPLLLLAVLAVTGAYSAEDTAPAATEKLQLTALQKDYLSLEPILVTARLQQADAGLPPSAGKWSEGTLRFEVTPPVKQRPGAKPLPVEASQESGVQVRIYDLLEQLQFPAEGTWTVRIALERSGGTLNSEPVTITIRRPGKGDPEAGPVERLHHLPWSNYVTDAFCGDTFDVVKRWPDSKLAKYCHYWNGLHHQHKKEYDKALASYRTVVAQHPGFVLSDHANYGIVQCLKAVGQIEEASRHKRSIRLNLAGAPPTLTFSAASRWLSLSNVEP